jgi:prophage regulatory protein
VRYKNTKPLTSCHNNICLEQIYEQWCSTWKFKKGDESIKKKENINMQAKLIRRKDVIELTTLSRSTIDRREAEGKFPQRLSLGKNIVAWRYQDIMDWIDAQQPKNMGVVA